MYSSPVGSGRSIYQTSMASPRCILIRLKDVNVSILRYSKWAVTEMQPPHDYAGV